MEILQNADTLISLQYIELVHVFVGHDRVAYALVKVIADNTVPFCCELAALRHQRHEIDGEGLFSSGRLRSDDLVKRDADKAERLLRTHLLQVDHIIQSRQIWILSGRDRLPVCRLRAALGFDIILRCHSFPPQVCF